MYHSGIVLKWPLNCSDESRKQHSFDALHSYSNSFGFTDVIREVVGHGIGCVIVDADEKGVCVEIVIVLDSKLIGPECH